MYGYVRRNNYKIRGCLLSVLIRTTGGLQSDKPDPKKSALKEHGILACGLAHRLWSGDITHAAGGVPVEIFFPPELLILQAAFWLPAK